MLRDLLTNFLYPFELKSLKLSEADVCENLLGGKSLIRWGDGEVTLISNKSIFFQEACLDLSLDLEAAINNCDVKWIICSPHKFVSCSIFNLIKIKKFKIWFRSRAFYINNFYRKKIQTGDAFGFRPETDSCYKQLLSKVITNQSNVLVISSLSSDLPKLLSMLESLTCDIKDIKFSHHAVPKCNSYNNKDDILNFIKNLEGKCLIISAAGPLTKAIVSNVVSSEHQIIDVGHFFDKVI